MSPIQGCCRLHPNPYYCTNQIAQRACALVESNTLQFLHVNVMRHVIKVYCNRKMALTAKGDADNVVMGTTRRDLASIGFYEAALNRRICLLRTQGQGIRNRKNQRRKRPAYFQRKKTTETGLLLK